MSEPLDPEVDPLKLFDAERQRGTFTRIEYGSRMDCTKNGCNPRHTDDGIVIPRHNTLQARRQRTERDAQEDQQPCSGHGQTNGYVR